MKHIIAALIAVCIVSSSLFAFSNTSSALDDAQMQQLWDRVNATYYDVGILISQLNGVNASKLIMIAGRLQDMKVSIDAIQARIGYNSTYSIKSDFDKVLAALYTANGSSRIEVINGNQLVLAHISENTYNKLQDTQTTVNQTKASVDASSIKIGSYEFNIQMIFLFALVSLFLIVVFMIVFIRQGKGKVREYQGSNESLFMPTITQQPSSERQRGAEANIPQQQPSDPNIPFCFKKFYDVLSPDCSACSLKIQCSGMQSQKKYPIRSRK